MKLYEFEGKSIFQKSGIPIPRGKTVKSAEQAAACAESLLFPVAVKSQVLRGGRGKAGGIKFAENLQELDDCMKALLGFDIHGEKVSKILIEEKCAIESEYYAGITFDPERLLPLLIISAKGGIDIEKIAASSPDEVIKRHLDPLCLPKPFDIMNLVLETGITGTNMVQFSRTVTSLVNCYFNFDAVTAEINPLIIDEKGKAVAADAKFEIDDSALYRVSEAENFHRSLEDVENPLEAEADKAGVAYVSLGDGNIGLIAGGAGVGMATMDMVFEYGGKPVNFLDLGGSATPKKTADALKIVLSTPGVEGVFVNVFGGINNCQEMAQGISDVIDQLNPDPKIVVKMRGHSQDAGWKILEAKKIPVIKFGTTEQGVKLLLDEMGEKGAKSRVNTY